MTMNNFKAKRFISLRASGGSCTSACFPLAARVVTSIFAAGAAAALLAGCPQSVGAVRLGSAAALGTVDAEELANLLQLRSTLNEERLYRGIEEEHDPLLQVGGEERLSAPAAETMEDELLRKNRELLLSHIPKLLSVNEKLLAVDNHVDILSCKRTLRIPDVDPLQSETEEELAARLGTLTLPELRRERAKLLKLQCGLLVQEEEFLREGRVQGVVPDQLTPSQFKRATVQERQLVDQKLLVMVNHHLGRFGWTAREPSGSSSPALDGRVGGRTGSTSAQPRRDQPQRRSSSSRSPSGGCKGKP